MWLQEHLFKMSLFVGNVSKNVTEKEIDHVFREFGPCKIDFRVTLRFNIFKVY